MTCYIIIYCPRNKEEGYFLNKFINNISKYEYIDLSDRVFLIVTDDSALVVRDKMARDLFPEDSLFILRSGTEAAWKEIEEERVEWLEKNL